MGCDSSRRALDSRAHMGNAEKRVTKEQEVLKQLVDDYDRRRSTYWGRFLLWLLRKTT